MGSETRKKQIILTVRCTEEEAALIKAKAFATSGSVSSYLRNLGVSYRVKTILDQKMFLELSRHFSDLGRIGGLLKMWLSNKERVDTKREKQIKEALQSLHTIQTCIRTKLEKL